MKFSCGFCRQTIECNEEIAGQVIACPNCGKKLVVPTPSFPPAEVPPLPVPVVRRSVSPAVARARGPSSDKRPPKRGASGFRKFLLFLLLVLAGAIVYAKYQFNESPRQLWKQLVEQAKELIQPQPTPTPTPTPTPVPTSEPTPSPIPTPTRTPTATSTPLPDAVEWILKHKEYWPREVTLAAPAEFPLVYHGKVVGSAKAQTGISVKVVLIEPGMVTASFGGGTQRVPMAATDLRQRAEAEMAKAASEPIPPAGITAPAPTVVPAPSVTAAVTVGKSGGLAGGLPTVGEGEEQAVEQYGTPYAQVPEPKDIVLYQVNIRAFSATDNFAGVQARLDAIKALGVNVLYLLPVYPVGVLKSVNSPYCVKDYMSVNREFGTLSDLRRLVAAAHERNMAVLFDWVADHTSWDNAWIMHKSWYQQDSVGNIISPPNRGWPDVAALDYKNAEMRKAMIEAMKYWVYQTNIDGYRCDAADFVPAEFWQQAIKSLGTIKTHKLLFLAEGTRKENFTAGFQLQYGMGFFSNLLSIYGEKASVRSIDSLNTTEYLDAAPNDRVVRYISNHDVIQLNGTPLELFGGKNGSLAAFVVAAYMKGVPMVYGGQEVGCPVRLPFMSAGPAIDWKINPEMPGKYKQIIGFRNSSGAIKQGRLFSFSNDDVCAFTKTLETEKVLVVVNLRDVASACKIPSTLVGTEWRNVFDGTGLSLPDQINLQPFQYLVFKNRDNE